METRSIHCAHREYEGRNKFKDYGPSRIPSFSKYTSNDTVLLAHRYAAQCILPRDTVQKKQPGKFRSLTPGHYLDACCNENREQDAGTSDHCAKKSL